MPNVKKISFPWSETGKTLYCIVRRETDGYYLNDADGAFANAPADPYISLTEDGIIKGLYELVESRSAWNDGNYMVIVYRQTAASPAPVSDMLIGSNMMTIVSDEEVTNVHVLSQANIDFGALQKTSLNAATPASVQNIDVATLLISINAEVVDALGTDTIAEMAQGDPPASPTIKQILNYLYRRFRNKNETTATENKIYDDAGTTVLIKESHIDNGSTFTKGKYGTGA